MGFAIIFKRLAEVNILHEYYLLQKDGEPFFGLPETDRKAVVDDLLARKRYNINRLFDIQPTEQTNDLLNSYNIRKIDTPLGFFLGMEVEEVHLREES